MPEGAIWATSSRLTLYLIALPARRRRTAPPFAGKAFGFAAIVIVPRTSPFPACGTTSSLQGWGDDHEPAQHGRMAKRAGRPRLRVPSHACSTIPLALE